jgi:ParB family chromosome partitioning protein
MAKNSRDAYGADGEQKVLLIDPDRLKLVEDEKHPLYDRRVHLPVDEGLVVSIMEHGVLENVGIVKDPETGEVLVSYGRQRVKATREANKRLRKSGAEPINVPCLVKRHDMATLFGMSIAENEQRQADSPLGRAEKARRMLDLGKSETQIATAFGWSVQTVKNMLLLLDATAAVKKAVESGAISVSEGYGLAKLEPDEQRARLEKIKAEAPRQVGQGKQRARGAKKRREIVRGTSGKEPKSSALPALPTAGGTDAGMRSRADVEEMVKMLGESIRVSGHDKDVADAVLRWVLGEDCIQSIYMEETGT